MQALKPLLNFRGRPWIIHQLDQFRRNGGKQAVVVLGHQANLIRAHLEEVFSWDQFNLTVADNQQFELGQFSSLQVGLTQINSDAAFITPIDVPIIQSSLFNLLEKHPAQVVLPANRNGKGHPILVRKKVLKKILESDPGFRLDHLIQKLPKEYVGIAKTNDPQINLNLNRPQKYAEYCAAL